MICEGLDAPPVAVVVGDEPDVEVAKADKQSSRVCCQVVSDYASGSLSLGERIELIDHDQYFPTRCLLGSFRQGKVIEGSIFAKLTTLDLEASSKL